MRILTPTSPDLTLGSNRLSAIAVASVVFPEATGPTKAILKLDPLLRFYWIKLLRPELCFDTGNLNELVRLKMKIVAVPFYLTFLHSQVFRFHYPCLLLPNIIEFIID